VEGKVEWGFVSYKELFVWYEEVELKEFGVELREDCEKSADRKGVWGIAVVCRL